jgi:cell division protein FtsL
MAKNTESTAAVNEKERIYAPSNGSLAYRTDYAYRTAQLAPATKRRQQNAPSTENRRKKARKSFSIRALLTQNRFMPKLFIVGCAVAVAAAAFYTVIVFAQIAGVQANINDLNSQIESTRNSIEELSFSTQPVINAAEFAEATGLVPSQP